jgi:predicted RNase H-like HicB family nuclease
VNEGRRQESGRQRLKESNSSAYVPDLPGCIATGATLEPISGWDTLL